MTAKKSVFEQGEDVYVILERELKPFVNYDLNKKEILKMIDRIRSVERGLVKRNLRTEEAVLKDTILRMNKSLRWAQDLIKLTLIPSDLKYLVETRQITCNQALKMLTERKRENYVKKTTSYYHIMKEVINLLEDIKNGI